MFQCLLVMKLISKDTNGLDIGSVGAGGKSCLAGQACGGSLLGKSTDGSGAIPFARGVAGYIGLYGTGQFDGQGSGHDFMGTLYHPPMGSVNSCDGGRGHGYCDYRQE